MTIGILKEGVGKVSNVYHILKPTKTIWEKESVGELNIIFLVKIMYSLIIVVAGKCSKVIAKLDKTGSEVAVQRD